MHRNVTPAPAGRGEWHAAYTFARREKKAYRTLREYGFESYLPCVTRVRQWHDRKKLVEFPLFAGYVFVRFELSRMHVLLDVPGIVYMVRTNGQLATIRQEEIDNIARFAAALEQTGLEPPQVAFMEGQRVRIMDGPFAGVEGVVLQRRGRGRVIVGVQSIGVGYEINVNSRMLKRLG